MVQTPSSRGDRARQAPPLAPGVSFVTTGALSLLRHTAAIAWTVAGIGVLLMVGFARTELRRRHITHTGAGRPGDRTDGRGPAGMSGNTPQATMGATRGPAPERHQSTSATARG